MKKQTVKKLVLAKETIQALDEPNLKKALGGWDMSDLTTCPC